MPDLLSARRTAFTGLDVCERHSEARATVEADRGALALVHRGDMARAAVFHCPCGCGDVLVINLDARTPHAWRHRLEKGKLTLMPSVWRDTGCESHFVLWESQVYWCGAFEDEEVERSWPENLRRQLRFWWAEWRRARGKR
jgi:hypothetical protein